MLLCSLPQAHRSELREKNWWSSTLQLWYFSFVLLTLFDRLWSLLPIWKRWMSQNIHDHHLQLQWLSFGKIWKYQELALLHQCSRQSCAIHVLRNNQTTQKQPTTTPPNKLTFCWTLHSSFWPYFKNQKRECFVVWSVKPAQKNSELPSFFGDPWGNEKIRGGFSKFAKGFPFFPNMTSLFLANFICDLTEIHRNVNLFRQVQPTRGIIDP